MPDSTNDYSDLSTLALQAQSELEHLRHLLTDSEASSSEADAVLRDRLLTIQGICNRALGLLPAQKEQKEDLLGELDDSDCSISLQGTVNPDRLEISTEGDFLMASTGSDLRMLLRTETIYRVRVHQIQVSGEIMNI
jgi:hypothetical protein